jgi:hypothetical protein
MIIFPARIVIYIYKICEIHRSIFSSFYNISEPKFAISFPERKPGARVLIPPGYLHPGKRKH